MDAYRTINDTLVNLFRAFLKSLNHWSISTK